MKNRYLIINRWAMSMDSFRYTHARQYIAKRDDGSLQPVIHSILPLFMAVVGATFLSLVAMAFCIVPLDKINMTTTPTVLFIAFMMVGIGGGLLIGDYRLVYAVGPKSYDGKRKFWFEDEEERTMLAQCDEIGADNL